ncbi:hypothetical protein [Marinilabilia sp.]|nr:hypothetical protein [Marinilabilia sp.]
MILIVAAKISEFLKIAYPNIVPLQNIDDKSGMVDSKKSPLML